MHIGDGISENVGSMEGAVHLIPVLLGLEKKQDYKYQQDIWRSQAKIFLIWHFIRGYHILIPFQSHFVLVLNVFLNQFNSLIIQFPLVYMEIFLKRNFGSCQCFTVSRILYSSSCKEPVLRLNNIQLTMAHGKSSYEQGAAETYIAGMLCAWAFIFYLCCKCIWMPVCLFRMSVPLLSWTNSIIWRSKCSARYSRMCRLDVLSYFTLVQSPLNCET